jgi:radical SAM superfamily enzyme YgiQ (UPF0313 family)
MNHSGKPVNNLLEKGTKCLIVQSKFSKFSYLNYIDVCKIAGAKYPVTPLGLMTVAALFPQQWKFKLVDENVEPLLAEHFEWADIVCTGGMLCQQEGTFSIINKSHQYGCPAVVGGPDPTSQPGLYKSADYLLCGEGEITIPMFIKDLEKGCMSGEYKSTEMADMTKAVVPRFDLIRPKDYLLVGMQYSRGCPFNCEFCDVIELYGRKPRTKTTDQIINELQNLYKLGYRAHIFFVDDNFIGNKKNAKELLVAIREWSETNHYPFYFGTQAPINIADDEDLLQMMKDVDFRFINIGIETPEDKILKLAQKKQNINRSIRKIIKKIYSYGMIVDSGFIVGFDNENDRTAEKIISCIQDSGICMAMIGTLYALPNTQLAKRLKKEGRLFGESTTITDNTIKIDQMSSGLNFITTRPRVDILKDFVHIIKYVYDPDNYYKRVIYTSLNLNPAKKYRPGIAGILKTAYIFSKVCFKVGLNRKTGWLYWKMLFTVLFRNPRAIESAVTLAVLFVHFYKQSRFIIDITNKKIKYIESCGGEMLINQCCQ